jgi:EmrB/QacA subfamily drug resistance transporter
VFVTNAVRRTDLKARYPVSATLSAPAPTTAAAQPPAYRWRWVVLAIVLVAEIMDLLDSTVITIAAPTVRAELGGGASAMQWWAAGYTLAFGVLMIVGARLGDIYGRRRVFLVGIAGFTLASMACALAPSPDALIATRVLQGGFGALLIPQGLGVIKNVFPPKEMGGAFAAFGPVMGLAAIAGPILAGWLVTADLLGTGWRMIFLLNVPLGVVGFLGALRFMPESKSSTRIRLDPLGIVLISAASLAIIYPLVQGRELGWPAWTFALMGGGVALLGVFAVVERRTHGTPMIEPSLLRNRAYRSGLLVGLAFFAGFAGLVMVTSLFFQLADPALGRHGDHGGRVVRAHAPLRAQGVAGRRAGHGRRPRRARVDRHALGRRGDELGDGAREPRDRPRARVRVRPAVQRDPRRRPR